VINLAAEKTYSNLDATLAEANQHKTEWFDGVHSCVATDTVLTVIERLVKTDVARLVVVDEEEKVVGVVTVSDVIRYLVILSLPNLRSRRKVGTRREDSIGEEFEDFGDLSYDDLSLKSLPDQSCSPPRWFQV
jgi:predicted transcriptional regulator